MIPHWPSPAITILNSSLSRCCEQVTRRPSPVTTSSSVALSTCAPKCWLVLPSPPTLSVPPTVSVIVSANTGGVRFLARGVFATSPPNPPGPAPPLPFSGGGHSSRAPPTHALPPPCPP